MGKVMFMNNTHEFSNVNPDHTDYARSDIGQHTIDVSTAKGVHGTIHSGNSRHGRRIGHIEGNWTGGEGYSVFDRAGRLVATVATWDEVHEVASTIATTLVRMNYFVRAENLRPGVHRLIDLANDDVAIDRVSATETLVIVYLINGIVQRYSPNQSVRVHPIA